MNNFKKNIYRTENDIDSLPIGILVFGAKRGNSNCSGGLCTLNNSVIDIIIYTTDGHMSVGQTIYSDINLTTPYLTANYVSESIFGIYEVFTVDGSGVLNFKCVSDGGCG